MRGRTWNRNTFHQRTLIALSKAASPEWRLKCSEFALAALSKPPRADKSRRVYVDNVQDGLLYQFFIPDWFAPTTNRMNRMNEHEYSQLKESCLAAIRHQSITIAESPLEGRPVVLAMRFTRSVHGTDVTSDWSKVPVDCLLPVNNKRGRRITNGIGIIKDDNMNAIDLHTWWEPGVANDGFVWLRVYAPGIPYSYSQNNIALTDAGQEVLTLRQRVARLELENEQLKLQLSAFYGEEAPALAAKL